MPVKLNGSTSGSVTIDAPAVAGTTTLTLPATTGTFNTSGAVNEVPAGSAAAPSIYSTGDTNTGIFFPAADTIAFAEGGAEAMRINSSGNVLIGTTVGSTKISFPIGTNPTIGQTAVTGHVAGNVGSVGIGIDDGGGYGGFYVHNTHNGTYSSTDLRFLTGEGGISVATERMRLNSSGNLMIQDTTSYARLTVTHAGAVEFGITTNNTNTGGAGQTSIGFRRNGAFVGTITTTSSATAYNTSSDYRLKNSVAPMTTGVATIAALKPVTYKWNVDDSSGEGFIAHELQEIIPLAVMGAKDEKDAEGNPVHQGVDYSKIVVHLVAAIQEQQVMIQALQADIAVLKGA